MKQLYYTVCSASQGLGHVDGFQLRAASPGLTSDQRRAAEKCAGYGLPSLLTPSDEIISRSPVRLALLDAPDAARMLCHSVYAGHDPLNPARQGNYFSHLLLDLPPEIDVRRAIRSWHSNFWKRKDEGSGTQLQEARDLPSGDEINDEELMRFLQEGAKREVLRFVAAALLTIPPEARIFLGAAPRDVAMCVYGLSRVLPPTLLRTFTFSTYEYNPLMTKARLIGTCWGDGPPGRDVDLPLTCYSPPHAGYNSYTGRKSESISLVPRYVDAALQDLAAGRFTEIESFLEQCEKIGVKDAQLLEPFYRLERKAGLPSRAEFQQVLQAPLLAGQFLANAQVQRQVVEWAVEDAAFASQEFPRLRARIDADPTLRSKFMNVGREIGLTALRQGNVARARLALERIFIPSAPDRTTIWTKVIQDLGQPSALPWAARAYLLKQVSQERPNAPAQEFDALMKSMLTVSENEFIDLLELDIPPDYKLTAWWTLTREGKVSSAIVKALSRFPKVAVGVVEMVVGRTREEEKAAQLGRAILDKAAGTEQIVEELVGRPTIPPSVLDTCLELALQKGLDPVALAQKHGRLLAQRLATCSVLECLVRRFVERGLEVAHADSKVSEFIAALAQVAADRPEIVGLLAPVAEVASFLKAPTLDERELKRVAGALTYLKGPNRDRARAQVLDLVRERLYGCSEAANVQVMLEAILGALGPCVPEGASGLYRKLVSDYLQRPGFGNGLELVSAFLAVALSGARSSELAKQLGLDLLQDAGDLAEQIGKNASKRQFEWLDKRAQEWPMHARALWNFMARFIRPAGLLQKLRRRFVLLVTLLAGVGVGAVLKWWNVL